MWSSLFLALFALACGATYVYTVQEEAVVFSTAIATATWSLLALAGGSIEVVTDSGIETIAAGPVQWLFAGIALLSFLALVGSILGYYPDQTVEHRDFRPD